MKASLIAAVTAYKLVWFRAACYFFIPAGMLFLNQTETYGDATWAGMGYFLKGRLALACIIAGAASLCAYIDSSLQKANVRNEEIKQEISHETEMLRRRDISDTRFLKEPVDSPPKTNA